MRKIVVALALLLPLSVTAATPKDKVNGGKCEFSGSFNLEVKRDAAGQIEAVDLKDGVTVFKACPALSELVSQIDEDQFAVELKEVLNNLLQQADDNK